MKHPLKSPHASVPGPRPQTPAASQRAAARFAFTLLELLIAISIIAILASLILAVAGRASTRVHEAQVTADIATLSTGIAAFKQKFGIEPPSSITVYEQGTNNAPTGTGWNADPRSMSIIRQIWPNFDFTYAAEGGQVDINGDGFYDGDGVTVPPPEPSRSAMLSASCSSWVECPLSPRPRTITTKIPFPRRNRPAHPWGSRRILSIRSIVAAAIV